MNNVGGLSNRYDDEIISLSSSSSTVYDSGASTASLDLASLYESQRIELNNRSRSLDDMRQHGGQQMVSNNQSVDIGYDSGIDVDSNDFEPMIFNQVIEYTVRELSPIQPQSFHIYPH